MRLSPYVREPCKQQLNISELSMNKPAIGSCVSARARHNQSTGKCTETRQAWNRIVTFAVTILTLSFAAANAAAQVNGVGSKPYLGWSTFSEQTIVPSGSVMNEQ